MKNKADKYDIYIGLNSHIASKVFIKSDVVDILNKYSSSILGYTITDAVGTWKTVPENTVIVTVLDIDYYYTEATIRRLVSVLKRDLSQESILVTKTELLLEFV